MRTQITLITAAITAISGGYSTALLARPLLPDGATLTITSGVPVVDSSGNQLDVSSGSYFGMDLSGNSRISGTEKTILEQGQFGIRVGVETTAGASHTGAILPGDTNEVDAPWLFSSSTGSSQFVPGSGGPTETTEGIFDWTGFVINWNANVINMGGGTVWQPGNCDVLGCTGITFTQGNADFSWSGVYGDPYVLQYTAVVPSGSFTGTQYYLHFEGTVIAPPNAPPVANPFSVSMLSNSTSLVDVAANATDTDGNLDPSTVVISNDGSCAPQIINNNNGTVTLPACSTSTYSFDYTISDTLGASDTATVTVTVSANPPPNPLPDTASTNGDTPVNIIVLANDEAPGNPIDPTTVAIATGASSGGTSIDATTGVITYTADTYFSGVDTFTYTVDSTAPSAVTSAPATVTVTVNAMNNPASNAIFTPGDTATSIGSTNGVITYADIGVEDDAGSTERSVIQACIGGCFDFQLSGITGTEAMVVLPLSTAIPAPISTDNSISYRKLIGSTWQGFDSSGNDIIHTAPGTISGTDVICPAVTDPIYATSTGLTEGHQCVRLTIVDNGPNDNNPTIGTIADPGGIAETGIVDNRVASTSGCSIAYTSNSNAKDHAEWILVAGFIALLGLFRRKPDQV